MGRARANNFDPKSEVTRPEPIRPDGCKPGSVKKTRNCEKTNRIGGDICNVILLGYAFLRGVLDCTSFFIDL